MIDIPPELVWDIMLLADSEGIVDVDDDTEAEAADEIDTVIVTDGDEEDDDDFEVNRLPVVETELVPDRVPMTDGDPLKLPVGVYDDATEILVLEDIEFDGDNE